MKYTLSAAIFVIALCFQTVYSQNSVTGTVIDVIDGRTVVVQSSAGSRLNVRLRFVEVPEPEQPLAAVVKDHLRKLSVGKNISVVRIGLYTDKIVGVGTVEERGVKTDLSKQLLRDGAGWFDVNDEDSAVGSSANPYREVETLARGEKRGVWGVPAMKTPWDFRREKELAALPAPTPAPVESNDYGKTDYVKDAKTSLARKTNEGRPLIYDFDFGTKEKTDDKNLAASTNPSAGKNSNGTLSANLNQVYFAHVNKGTISTKPYEFEIKEAKRAQKATAMFLYGYSLENGAKNIDKVALMVMTEFDTKPYLQGKNVEIILADNSKVSFGTPKYNKSRRIESLTFENIDRQALLSILTSDSATFLIGKSKITIDDSYKQILNEFVGTIR